MEENRRIRTILAFAGAALLIFLAGYPVVREKISEYRKKDIFLGEEQSPGNGEETEEERKTGPGEEDEEFEEEPDLPNRLMLLAEEYSEIHPILREAYTNNKEYLKQQEIDVLERLFEADQTIRDI